MRTAKQVIWASPCPKPAWLRPVRLRGKKAAGIAYQHKLERALPHAVAGQWFEFIDREGRAFCQPDLLLELAGRLFVLEAKLSWKPQALRQLQKLYLPVLRTAFPDKPIHGIIVCKHITGYEGTPVPSLDKALALAAALDCFPVLHWLGHAPLVTRSPDPKPASTKLFAAGANAC